MKTILLSVFALGMFAAPALAEDATNDPFGGRSVFYAVQPMNAVSGTVDYTATAAIPISQFGAPIADESAEIVYNRFNR